MLHHLRFQFMAILRVVHPATRAIANPTLDAITWPTNGTYFVKLFMVRNGANQIDKLRRGIY